MLCYVTLFTTLLMTVVHVRAQCGRPVLGQNQLLAEGYKETFSDGVTVKVKCASGYVPSGSYAKRSITCSGTQWSELELECKKKSCGNPGDIHHGRYQFPPRDGILYGSTITAVCDEGYRIVGVNFRNCRETGWDGRAPVCEVVKCERPPSITNGEFEPEEESYDYGQSVIYTCERDFDHLGPSEITCSSEGTFQPAPPLCQRVYCERPIIPNAIRVEGKSPPYRYKNFIRYECNRGFKMQGSNYMTCMENGWNPPPPTCNVVTCPKPPEIENGFFEPQNETYIYDQKVKYLCHEGFYLSGTSTISCTEDGTFQTGPRSCQVITCEPPSEPHGRISPESLPERYKYNDTVHISCEKGYKIKESNQLICKENGWSPSRPQCLVVTCSAPDSVKNGEFSDNKVLFNYNENITLLCKEGFQREGAERAICNEHGKFTWIGEIPLCNVVTCSAPDSVTNGEFSDNKVLYNYNEKITLSCKDGFQRKGAERAICNEHGKFMWTGEIPLCKEISCGVPDSIQNGKYLFPEGILFGAKMTAQCNEGYQLSGYPNRTCTATGWNGSAPTCDVVKCSQPPNIKHGQFKPKEDLYTYGDAVIYSCGADLDLIGPSTLTCTGNATFQSPPPQCQRKSCGHPGKITNGRYLFPERILFGATITAQCNEGYLLVGQPHRVCRGTHWDGRVPECEVVQCQKPPSITDGIFKPVNTLYYYGDIILYSCKEHFDLIGSSVITCSDDGTFQPPPPRCLRMFCESPAVPNAVKIERKSPDTHEKLVCYRCNEGYKMEGSDCLTCTENGWNRPPPNCAVITCSKPPAINNGLFNPMKEIYEYKQTVTYSCNKGFRLKGNSTISCTGNGTFGTSFPVCQVVKCQTPYIIANGTFKPVNDSYDYQEVVAFHCHRGFDLIGASKITCSGDGTFQPLPPHCRLVRCSNPPAINNGLFHPVGDVYEYKQTVTYSCNEGFKLDGNSVITCTEDGTFNLSPPECRVITCPKPPALNNGTFNALKDVYHYGQNVTYSCNKRFQLQGNSTVSCTEDGTFGTSFPVCQEVTDDALDINNATTVEGLASSVYRDHKVPV